MARKLFDNGLLSVLSLAGAIGVGWKLHFYTGGTTTPITTYNARTGGSANANPLPTGADGRFPLAWVPDGQTIKWVLTDENDFPKVTVDDFLIDQATAAASIDASLTAFLAGAALPIANGGTGSTSAVNALAALGALPLAGGIMTNNIVRSGKGAHLYFSDSAMVNPVVFLTASGASDPRGGLPGQIWLKY